MQNADFYFLVSLWWRIVPFTIMTIIIVKQSDGRLQMTFVFPGIAFRLFIFLVVMDKNINMACNSTLSGHYIEMIWFCDFPKHFTSNLKSYFIKWFIREILLMEEKNLTHSLSSTLLLGNECWVFHTKSNCSAREIVELFVFWFFFLFHCVCTAHSSSLFLLPVLPRMNEYWFGKCTEKGQMK